MSCCAVACRSTSAGMPRSRITTCCAHRGTLDRGGAAVIRVDPRDLAARLNVDIAHAEREAGTRAAYDLSTAVCTEFDLGSYPGVAAALAKVTADRSGDTNRILSECFDAGLTQAHGRWAVHRRPDLVARLEEFARRRNPVDAVAVCWDKLAPGLMTPRASAIAADGHAALPPPPGGQLQDTLDVFGRWLHLEDPAAVLLTAAAVVANHAEGDPVWLLLVGPALVRENGDPAFLERVGLHPLGGRPH
jgi:hypothetical protein